MAYISPSIVFNIDNYMGIYSIDEDSDECFYTWYKNDDIHRENDRPAVVYDHGAKKWYRDNLLHRVGDQPAYIHKYGTQLWYMNSVIHRCHDLPAVVGKDGSCAWFINGVNYREIIDQPSIICGKNSDICYLDEINIDFYIAQEWHDTNGMKNRDDDKPALIDYHSAQVWFRNDLLHRDHGLPAVIFSNGIKYWYRHGIKQPEIEYEDIPELPMNTFHLQNIY
jgi:hypothetical protein